MAIDTVRNYFKTLSIENKILEFDMSSATVELAAQALGCEGNRIAKTLAFIAAENCVLIVTAGDAKIDNAKYKSKFGVKAKMIPKEDVQRLVGHDVGGVCPFAVNEDVRIYLDCALKRFDTVFPACGSSNSAIEMTLNELEKYSNCIEWIDVCNGYKE